MCALRTFVNGFAHFEDHPKSPQHSISKHHPKRLQGPKQNADVYTDKEIWGESEACIDCPTSVEFIADGELDANV